MNDPVEQTQTQIEATGEDGTLSEGYLSRLQISSCDHNPGAYTPLRSVECSQRFNQLKKHGIIAGQRPICLIRHRPSLNQHFYRSYTGATEDSVHALIMSEAFEAHAWKVSETSLKLYLRWCALYTINHVPVCAVPLIKHLALNDNFKFWSETFHQRIIPQQLPQEIFLFVFWIAFLASHLHPKTFQYKCKPQCSPVAPPLPLAVTSLGKKKMSRF